ncbi:LeoA/HP0731 family dynamin-like GTPase [Diaphorobacter caeni]|uniref:LeoA/HP0731 family dynamin-like GTPase n=1 Tax=Diaphorobacter caeni TaxID=2784387 RepID=UPI00189006C5|nr:LeoA/HP0731 family dynamin-like GTPase [Diaphorobacter caeni]MBF5007233.1 50S ribosome-binding GTPase [Diaphorobacter caeni]
MTSAIQSFEQQKQQALGILSSLSTFVQEGSSLGIQVHKDLVEKLQNSIKNAKEQKLKVALIGGFSEGKTSIAAAWLEELDRKSMNISQAESSSEVQIYEYKDQLQIIDTPGLFGFKEKTNATSQEIEKYKDITKHYVSEAHLVLYVMNSANPIKESHTEDLKWLFRTLNLLPRTVFVLSRFDDVADVAEDADFQEKFLVKKNSVTKRLNDLLELTPQEQSDLSIVAVSANPFDKGVEHWLRNLPEFRSLSRIGVLQSATQQKIERNGGLLALANETQKSIISDVITQQMPAAKEAYALLADEARRVTEIKQSQSIELQKVHGNIGQAQTRLRGRLLRYFEDLQLQTRKVGAPTFNDFMHREIGNEGCLVQQRIQEIFSEEIGSINTDLYRIQTNVNNELKHYDDVLSAMSKKGVKFLSQPGVITKDNVLLARDGLNAATKMVGLDISKYLKFKPWGATKLASGLGSALAVAGIALELWDSYKEQERQAQFAKVIDGMISNFQTQSKEVLQLIDAPDFADQFFPTFVTLKKQLGSIDDEMVALQKRQVQFKKWYDNGTAIDAEFREINSQGGNHQAAWESVPEIVIDTTPIIESIAPKTPPAIPQAETKPAKASLWSKLFS